MMGKTLTLLFSKLWVSYDSAQEKSFCQMALARHEEAIQETIITVSLIFHLISSSLFWLFIPKDFVFAMTTVHGLLGVFQLFVVLNRGKTISFAIATSISYIYFIGGHTYILVKTLDHSSAFALHACAMSLYLSIHALHVLTAPSFVDLVARSHL